MCVCDAGENQLTWDDSIFRLVDHGERQFDCQNGASDFEGGPPVSKLDANIAKNWVKEERGRRSS